MKLSCIVIDDEPLAVRQIVAFIARTDFLELVPDGACNSPEKFLKVAQEYKPTLAFLDINMPDISGMELARSLSKDIKVVFVTAYDDYALEGFRVNALDYLLKPVSYKSFLEASERARQHALLVAQGNKGGSEGMLQIKSDSRIVRIPHKEIIMVESQREYVLVHRTSGQGLLSLMRLKSMEEMLQWPFVRVHRSFIVNMDMASAVGSHKITMNNGQEAPVGGKFKKGIHEFIKREAS